MAKTTKNLIQSILFVSSKPLSINALAKYTSVDKAEITTTLEELVTEHRDSGIVLMEANGEYQFATNPENVTEVKNFLNSDLREKLTDATVEVLAIIAYRQPIGRSEIEAIRGVNSQYSIRHLLMRGLIEKVPNPNDARGNLYEITTEFLQQLGISSIKDLPDFETFVSQVKLPETPATKNEDGVTQPTLDDPIETEGDESNLEDTNDNHQADNKPNYADQTIATDDHNNYEGTEPEQKNETEEDNTEEDDNEDDDEDDDQDDEDDDDEDEKDSSIEQPINTVTEQPTETPQHHEEAIETSFSQLEDPVEADQSEADEIPEMEILEDQPSIASEEPPIEEQIQNHQLPPTPYISSITKEQDDELKS